MKNRKKTGKAAYVAGILILHVASAQGSMLDMLRQTGTSYFGSIAEFAAPGLRSLTQSRAVQAICKNPRETAAII